MSTSEQLEELLKKFILEQHPQGWTREQLDLLDLAELLKHAGYYVR
jgi:hypothetical protein